MKGGDKMQEWKSLGFEDAKRIVEGAIEATRKTGERPMSIAVVDRQGAPVYLVRMDGAPPGTARMALSKCYSVMTTLRDTISFRETLSKANTRSCEMTHPKFTTIPGGVLVKTKDGTIVGAVGTSGRAAVGPGGDEEIARAGAAAF
jgi:uncharacterized protein GlcG (DUF336 family)